MPSEFRAKNCPRSKLFLDMPEQDVDKILHAGRPLRLKAKSIVTTRDESSTYLYFLWRGRARFFYETREGKKLIMIWRSPGQIIGAASFKRQLARYLLSSETVHDSVFLVWDFATVRTLGGSFPRLFDNLIGMAYEYVAWYIAAYAGLASNTAQKRLAHLFSEISPVIGEETPNGVELDVTNEELADCVVLTPYSVSRILSAWDKIGAVSKKRGKVIIHSIDRLYVDIPLDYQPNFSLDVLDHRHKQRSL